MGEKATQQEASWEGAEGREAGWELRGPGVGKGWWDEDGMTGVEHLVGGEAAEGSSASSRESHPSPAALLCAGGLGG